MGPNIGPGGLSLQLPHPGVRVRFVSGAQNVSTRVRHPIKYEASRVGGATCGFEDSAGAF